MPDERAPESFGSWLRQRRKALDLTQAAVAACVGCAEVTIRKLEAEVARPSRQIAKRLVVCLEIPPSEHDLFLQIARGERPVDRLPSAHPGHTAPPPASVEGPLVPLPLDAVPTPAPLPSGSRMPLRRNPLFVGRDADLRQLARALTVSATAAIGQVEIAAATGLGGIGKTQLACEFVHRYGSFFAGGVFWLSFADPATVPAEVAACGGVEGMRLSTDFNKLPLDEQVQLVLAEWRTSLPRLLVFDNCEDEALLEAWWPAHGGCRILVTSRRRHWDLTLGVQPVVLDVLPRVDSLRLLHHFRPDLPVADAELAAIAAALGDLPLALHLAGSFLARYRHALTPAQYLQRLQTPTMLDDRSLREAGLSPTRHVQHVARTFEQSYTRLDAADPTDALALTLITHTACCAPGEPLPRWLLHHMLEVPEENPERVLVAEDAVTRLIDLGLLHTDMAENLRMHRLVAAFVRVVLVDGAVQTGVEATMLRVVDTLNQQRNPRPVLTIQPHLRFITEAAQGRIDAHTAGLCHALGYHLWQLGVYGEAQGYLEQAVAIRRRVLGADHPDTARSLLNLGAVFSRQGRYAAAQDHFEQALAIQERALGQDHPDTAISRNSLGAVFYEQGQYAAAQGHFEQALAIQERALGQDHPSIAMSLNNLGSVLKEQGQYAAAQRSYEQALKIRQRVLEADHPSIAMSLNNVGEVLKEQARYAEAQRYHEQALAIRQRVLGADHPDTAQSLHNLGAVVGWQGQYAVAQHALEQALATYRRVLGDDHPDTARSLNRLGEVLKEQGQYAAAQDYFARAVTIRERMLGDDHPDTARSLRGLGEVLHAQGNAMQARCYLERAWTIFVERLGSQHPDTEQTRQLLARLDADGITAERESGG